MNFAWVSALASAWPNAGYLLTVFLLSIRISAVFLLTPVLYAFDVPAIVRLLLVVGLSAGLAAGQPMDANAAAAMTQGQLLSACATELALGLTLALSVLCAFAAISFAGRLIDVQIGFGIAQVFDPVTRRQIPVISAAFEKLGVIVFFLVNGHHALLRGLAYSIERFPPGRGFALDAAAPWLIKQVAGLFSLGFALAAPVVVCLLMTELALGVVARNLPQMNMFVIGIPVKVVVGLAVLTLWFAGMGEGLGRIYLSIYRTWDGIFAAAPAARGR